MTEQKDFLDVLAKDEDDTATRLVYSDWLDENGQHEEADRQRKWPVAKQWLMNLCEQNQREVGDDDEVSPIQYQDLLERGLEAVTSDADTLWFSCGRNKYLCDYLRENFQEFWKNWSIVTGIPLEESAIESCSFSCAC